MSDRRSDASNSVGGGGKTAAQLHAEVLAEKRFADMMSAAGVSHNRQAVELLYFIPRQFRDAYISLFRRSMKGDDSGVDEAWRRNQSTGELGKATGNNDSGGFQQGYDSEGKGIPGTREARRTEFAPGQTAKARRGKKSVSGHKGWTVEDERAFELKELMDKRLRRMAREIEEKLTEWEAADEGMRIERGGTPAIRRVSWEEKGGKTDVDLERERAEVIAQRTGTKG